MLFKKETIKNPDLIILGIGNPGSEYSSTRHNVGIWAIDQLSKYTEIKIKKKKEKIQYGEGIFLEKSLVLSKSRVFINQSGLVVKYLKSKYKLEPQKHLIIYDDIHLPPGKIRIRKQGSPGGHNGMRSIVEAFGSQEFPRIRIGIGEPNNSKDQIDYVLSEPSDDERKNIETSLINLEKAISSILLEGIDKAMNSFN